MSIILSEWLTRLSNDYLVDYIPQGGAAVKVAVVSTEDTVMVKNAISGAASSHMYFVANVDAAITKVHMIHELFFAVSRQVDWLCEIDRYLRSLLNTHGINVKSDQMLEDIDGIAVANNRERGDLLNSVHSLITNEVFRNYRLSMEFRTAMSMLCRAAIDPQSVALGCAQVVLQWLRGEPVNLTVLKRYNISRRIGRHNARLLIRSLAVWQHMMGYPGTTLLLDIHAILGERVISDGGLSYTRNSILDTYEILRSFIDDTDELSHFLLVAMVGPRFIEQSKLSMENYTALKTRLVNEVRDLSHDNPLNAMVSLVCHRQGENNVESLG
ncbi:MAG: BREX system ATP-binding domain-containing protein [Armatimonadota bacterium]